MSLRRLASGVLCVISVGLALGVVAQHGRLAELRAERAKLVAQGSDLANGPASDAGEPTSGTTGSDAISPGPSAEILRLRSEVTQLTARKQAMAGARAENEKLHDQLAQRGTNVPGSIALPASYIRRTDAQMRGYDSPQNALESFLWAIQNQDFTSLLQAVTPQSAQNLLRQRGSKSNEEFFKDAGHIPGMNILEQKTLEDGRIELQIEINPGVPAEKMRLEQIDGQWKLAVF